MTLVQMLSALFGSTRPRGEQADLLEAQVAEARLTYHEQVGRVLKNSSDLRLLVDDTIERLNRRKRYGPH